MHNVSFLVFQTTNRLRGKEQKDLLLQSKPRSRTQYDVPAAAAAAAAAAAGEREDDYIDYSLPCDIHVNQSRVDPSQ
jgi:hypothetical protein